MFVLSYVSFILRILTCLRGHWLILYLILCTLPMSLKLPAYSLSTINTSCEFHLYLRNCLLNDYVWPFLRVFSIPFILLVLCSSWIFSNKIANTYYIGIWQCLIFDNNSLLTKVKNIPIMFGKLFSLFLLFLPNSSCLSVFILLKTLAIATK